MKSPAKGAATSIHVASSPDLEQVTGQYFANSKPKRSSKRSYDEDAAAGSGRSAPNWSACRTRLVGPRPE